MTFIFRFRNPAEELELFVNVAPPLNDDIRLTVDDYRNKLYEIMSTHHQTKIFRPILSKSSIKVHSEISKPESKSKIMKASDHFFKTSYNAKQKPYNIHPEPKVVKRFDEINRTKSLQTKSEPKIIRKCSIPSDTNLYHNSGGCKKHQSLCDVTREKVAKKTVTCKSNFYVRSFNSFNPNHGIITQSALTELRAAGIR